MTTAPSSPGARITDKRQLVEYLESGCKPPAAWRVGTEHEKFVFRRADLGDKGIFYRALVGPFATAEQANTFCSNLKAAGGNCFTQRN